MLLNTEFPEEIEKQASAIVDEELEKVAELEEVAASCMEYGQELAMQKIAEMEANYAEKVAAEEEEDEDEEDEEKKEEVKTASAMGDFILEGYWQTMMEKGAEYYGDENIYIEELCKEAGMLDSSKAAVGKALHKLRGKMRSAGGSIKGKASEMSGKVSDFNKKRYLKGRLAKKQFGKAKGKDKLKYLKMMGKAYSPELAAGGALAAGGTYAATRKKKK